MQFTAQRKLRGSNFDNDMMNPAIATVSLGRSSAGHNIIYKIKRAASAGFKGVEIFYECLEHLAIQLQQDNLVLSKTSLLEAARQVHAVCKESDITVVSLQPFLFYDGLRDEVARLKKIEELKLWFELARILHTDIIQIPSNFQRDGTTGDIDRIVDDLTLAAEMGSQRSPPIRFAYEAISWGNHVDMWEQSWEIVKRVNRANMGLCLDVFHIAGRIWADPTSPSGINDQADKHLDLSLQRLVNELDPAKIFYVQIGDAYRLDSPIVPGNPLFSVASKPRMSWSRNARSFLFEGYLPAWQVCEAIFIKLGWHGWVSLEMFHQTLYQPDPEMPLALATRAAVSWGKFLERLTLCQDGLGR
ncbi:hypothetical protein RBB50_010782 [Rhinocladiella similis]